MKIEKVKTRNSIFYIGISHFSGHCKNIEYTARAADDNQDNEF
jgi:hypothetical protein